MIKIGIITFSDGKDIVNDKLKPVNNSYINLIANKLKQTSYIEPIIAKEIVHNSVEAKEQAQYLRSKNCHGIIFNFAIILIFQLSHPVFLMSQYLCSGITTQNIQV